MLLGAVRLLRESLRMLESLRLFGMGLRLARTRDSLNA